jgi:hypothetical protein
MTLNQARARLITLSIICTGVVFLFFAVSPAMGFYALSGVEWRIPQMVIPIFVGYLASASHFLFSTEPDAKLREGTEGLFSSILYGGFGLFIICAAGLLFAFYESNTPTAPPNTGRSIEWLADGFTIILSILTASTSVLSSFLFSIKATGQMVHDHSNDQP